MDWSRPSMWSLDGFDLPNCWVQMLKVTGLVVGLSMQRWKICFIVSFLAFSVGKIELRNREPSISSGV